MMMNNMSQGLGSFNNMMPQNNMMQQNPYGQQMNPQMMGQQMQSPEMFSEQLMNPMMSQIQDPMQGLQPMAEPEGFGVYGQSLEGYAEGGEAVPRETDIMGQPHMLAYINPEEEMMLRQMGGSGDPGPGGVPSFAYGRGGAGSFSVNEISEDRRREMRDESQDDERRSQAANVPTLQQASQQFVANKAASDEAAASTPIKTFVNNLINPPAEFKSPSYLSGEGGSNNINTNAEKLAEVMERPTTIKGALTQAFDDVKMGIGALTGKATTPGYNERSRQSLAVAQEIEKKRQRDDDKDARRAAAAPVAAGTGIDTIPISTGLPSGSGTVGANYGGGPQTVTGGFVPSSDFDPSTGEIFGGGNTYGAMTDGSQLIKTLGPGGVLEYQILDPSGSSITNTFDNYQEAYAYATGTPYTPPAPVMLPPSVTPPPVVTPDPIVAPTPVPPAATVDPMTPVGGNFLLPGQQNFGPTPSAALNFDPNTYMQTPQNANVALPSMFQQSNPYTFEELLSQYKPAYEPIL
jgi:hypothetical protein